VSELARVGKRCVIVEPAPPSDLLGLRIASLYSRAKRELGQFEHYHHIDYWRKLLAIVKPDVNCQTFAFSRTPPPQAIQDTVALLIDTMAAEETPEPYMAELRALAARPDAKLLPQARYVIVGTSAGVAGRSTSRTEFRDRPKEVEPTAAQGSNPPGDPPTTTKPRVATAYASPDESEFPIVIPPRDRVTAASPAAAADSQIARNAFGLSARSEPAAPATAEPPVNNASEGAEMPFGEPGIPPAAMPADFGWAWEPPQEHESG
jgi:hypothetical protein